MKIQELFESENSDVKRIKATRAMKFSLKNGDTSLGVNLNELKCVFYTFSRYVYVGKPNELSVGDKCVFENAEKPGFNATGNTKFSKTELSGEYGEKVIKVITTFKEAVAHIKDGYDPRLIVNPTFLDGAKAPEVKKDEEPTEVEDGYFLLGYWGNPYRGDNEYFWSGPFTTRKAAIASGNRKQERGQPKTMRDWVKGSVQAIRGKDKFVIAAKKAGLNPNVDNLDWSD